MRPEWRLPATVVTRDDRTIDPDFMILFLQQPSGKPGDYKLAAVVVMGMLWSLNEPTVHQGSVLVEKRKARKYRRSSTYSHSFNDCLKVKIALKQ